MAVLRLGSRWISPRTRAILIRFLGQFLLLYFITFAMILPLSCNDLKNSIYYNKTAAMPRKQVEETLLSENNERVDQAKAFLASVAMTSMPSVSGWEASTETESKLKIEIIIISQSRSKIGAEKLGYQPYYLTQVVAKWVRLLQQEFDADSPYYYRASLCNVDPDPQSFDEMREMTKYFPVYNRFGRATKKFDAAKATKTQRKAKEKEDFIFCIDSALKSNPKYVLFLEDDALPINDFFIVLRHVLDTHLENNYERGEKQSPREVSWLKLYHPEYYSDFIAYEVERVPEWIATSVLFATLISLMNSKLDIFRGNVFSVWLVLLAYSLLLTHAIGRPNLMNLRRFFPPYFYSFYPAPGCCMPGMLFTNHGARGAITFMEATMRKHRRWAKDQVLDRFVEASEFPVNRYMVQPNLLTHIGMVSGVRADVDPSRVD